MHSSTFVMIPEHGDINDLVARALEPFSEDFQVPEYKRYLDPTEIVVMATHYKLKKTDSKKLATHMEDWCGCLGGVDERGLFAVSTLNPRARWDWYVIGGRWDGAVLGHLTRHDPYDETRAQQNVILSAALAGAPYLTEWLPHSVVTPEGSWHERETLVVEGWMKWRLETKDDAAWLREVRGVLETFPDHRVVGVDIHR
jgi:hypothetical protein